MSSGCFPRNSQIASNRQQRCGKMLFTGELGGIMSGGEEEVAVCWVHSARGGGNESAVIMSLTLSSPTQNSRFSRTGPNVLKPIG